MKEPNYHSLEIVLLQLSQVVTSCMSLNQSVLCHIKLHYDTFQTIAVGILQQTLERSHHQAIQLTTQITRSVLQLSQSILARLSSLISTGKSYAFDFRLTFFLTSRLINSTLNLEKSLV